MLKEITDWAVEIQNTPWKQFSTANITIQQGSKKLLDADLISSYAPVMTKNDYFKKLSEKAFGGQLKDDVKILINALVIYIFLKYKNLGVNEPEKLFGGEYKKAVLSFEENTSKGNKSTEQLLSEYGYNLPDYTNKLIMKIADIRVSLLE
jgi:hypothetical protein